MNPIAMAQSRPRKPNGLSRISAAPDSVRDKQSMSVIEGFPEQPSQNRRTDIG
jgi:hypothetical protein